MEYRKPEGGDEESADGHYKRFADETAAFFAERDHIFERGETGLSLMLPNLTLMEAIPRCEEFHMRAREKFKDFIRDPQDLSVGLSARSGRLIEADRLMLEADEALEKAKADPVSHIVAFKSDPEKYREYLKKNRG
jgi:GGDEF domain-containing protein